MPGIPGVRLLELARQLAPNMPTLVVTGYPEADTARRCRELGARGYVVKPFDPQVLMAHVRALLGLEEPPDEG